MNTKKVIKNICLLIGIISLSISLALVPTIGSIYSINNGLQSSYMYDEVDILEEDFYKSNVFEFDVLRPIAYWLSTSVQNEEELVEEYINMHTSTQESVDEYGNTIYNEDTGEPVYETYKPSREEALQVIAQDIERSKENLANLKNIRYLVINTNTNEVYTNTQYTSEDEFVKNIDDYLDIKIDSRLDDREYTKTHENQQVNNRTNEIDWKILDVIERNNVKIYASFPNTKEFVGYDKIVENYESFKLAIQHTRVGISVLGVCLITTLLSLIAYKINNGKVFNKESSLIIKVSRQIPLEIWIASISLVVILAVNSIYMYNWYNEWIYSQFYEEIFVSFMLLILLALSSLLLLYLFIKSIKSYDRFIDVFKYSIIGRIARPIFRLSKNSRKNIDKSIKNLEFGKRMALISGILISANLVAWFIDLSTWSSFYAPLTGIVSVVVLSLHFFKKMTYIIDIIDGTEKIKNGELDYKINIVGDDDFSTLAENINNIGQGLENSIDQQLRSERMKSELITNVSHDLKTPLTSIINYVELIKKEENIQPEHVRDYVNVLDSKSKRLKVLIEDLFEASKASSGNIELNMEKIEVKQLLRQSIGELEEKLASSNLDLKINMPKEKIYINADGRRMYRVFENLLSNVAKYSLENTRVYIDLLDDGENIRLTMKNISSYELNFDPKEIMERFKRADESRNTEGSGLGLAIARDLVSIQGGKFDIEIDGDLFKSIVEFKKFNEVDENN